MLRHYRCPTCSRLCSVPWEPPVWCVHHDSTFTPHGPEDPETEWTVMEPFGPIGRAVPDPVHEAAIELITKWRLRQDTAKEMEHLRAVLSECEPRGLRDEDIEEAKASSERLRAARVAAKARGGHLVFGDETSAMIAGLESSERNRPVEPTSTPITDEMVERAYQACKKSGRPLWDDAMLRAALDAAINGG